jgi:hypothetical protein
MSSVLVFGITLRSFFWNTYRSARRRSRLTLGVAVGTVAALAGILAGVLAGSAPTAHATASHPSGTRNSAVVRTAGHPQQAAVQHGASQHSTSQHGTSQHGAGQQVAAQRSAGQHSAGQHGADQQAAGQHGISHGAARPAVAQHAATAQRPAKTPVPATAARPYSIYDSVTPSAIPASQYSIATYANGHYAATSSQVAGRGSVLWIDTNATNPSASVLDVEPGDATPQAAASWAWHKLNSDPSALARIYTMRSEWPSVRAAISTLPSQMQSHVRYWIADPTGVQHLVPGSDATQWYWGTNYDITTANPGF